MLIPGSVVTDTEWKSDPTLVGWEYRDFGEYGREHRPSSVGELARQAREYLEKSAMIERRMSQQGIPAVTGTVASEHRIPLTVERAQDAATIPDDGSKVSSVCASKADALAAIQRLVEMIQLSQFCGENPHLVAEIIHAGLPVDDDEAILVVDSIRANLIERAGE